MSQKSFIYEGWVQHRRHQPFAHFFRYRLFMVYLDLSELESVLSEDWLWNTRKPALIRFRREDYLTGKDLSLEKAVRKLVAERTGSYPTGPIRMLSHLRYLGYCYNPVSFYYCFDKNDEMVETIVAEITNTPWEERFSYVLTKDIDSGEHNSHHFSLVKAFHVSPFISMDHRYEWRFSEPGKRITVHMENWSEGRQYFDATLSLERKPLTRRKLATAAIRYPMITVKVIGAIYWQALRLWLKGAPFYPHPKHEDQSLDGS